MAPCRRASRRPLRAAGAVSVAFVVLGIVAPVPVSSRAAPAPSPVRGQIGARTVTFAPPVDSAVRDPFRPPLDPYGPGNRGIEYDTVAGQVVHAAGDGVVAFAGAIGGARYVAIVHGAGLRTTYSHLDGVVVTRGGRVRRGDPVGTASAVPFHFGARRDGAYVDPAWLFAMVLPVRSVLVPIDRPWT